MLIDWFTVGAQAINFLILVWLLKRFLYGPVLAAVDAREKKVAAELADAQAKRSEALEERNAFLSKNEELERARAELLAKAAAEARVERERLLAEARRAADAQSTERRDALRREAVRLNEAIALRTEEEVFAIVRKVLHDLAAESLEEQIARVFAERLHGIDRDTREALGRALEAGAAPVVVRSAFDLSAAQRTSIQAAVDAALSRPTPVRFETQPSLVSGIEFSAPGQKIAWSVRDYVSSLQDGVVELLRSGNEKPAT